MRTLEEELSRRALDEAPEGIALVDAVAPGQPVVYVNAAFERLTGYAAAELVGRNLRLLQGSDTEQSARATLREAIGRGEACRVRLRNYRKDGTLFWSEIAIVPLYGPHGRLTHFAGYHRDATDRLGAAAATGAATGAVAATGEFERLASPAAVREDRLTGLATAAVFEELLKRDLSLVARDQRPLAVYAIDVDALELYNATFGRSAGDSAVRRVGHCIGGCIRRASDPVARVDGGRFLVATPGVDHEQALRIAQKIVERVRELRIHHPRATVRRYVTVSVGVAVAIPDDREDPAMLLERARAQLARAKQSGRDQVA
ncbi:MAG: diguanylate cyclase [Gammaproteobacteria bacterium]|nr:diguanylate cyclase [Gammaproteobacteria bacterium]